MKSIHDNREKIERILNNFPSNVQKKITEIIDNQTILIEPNEVKIIAKYLEKSIESLMLDLLPLASLYSCPPISNFEVGAICQGRSGNLYFGANTEFLKQPIIMSIHAEQSSINNAWLNGETSILSIATNYSPCGYCRQFLNELASVSTTKILFPNSCAQTIDNLLPKAFGPGDLGLKSGLLESKSNEIELQAKSQDLLTLAALDAAKKSYAPYSKSYSGIAIQTFDKKIYKGQYAENAAFNPSLLAIQSVLAYMNLKGEKYQNIERVVLVEKEPSKSFCSQINITRSLLESLSTAKLEVSYLMAD